MAYTTYSTIETRLLAMVGRNDAQTKTLLMLLFNQAQEALSEETYWQALETTATKAFVIGTVDYVLPTWIGSNFKLLYSIQPQVNGEYVDALNIVPQDRWNREIHFTDTSADPTHGVIFGDTLTVWPKPVSANNVRIKYYARPTEVTLTSSTISFPKEFETLLLNMTATLFWAAIEELNQATFYANLVSSLMKSRVASNQVYLNMHVMHSARGGKASSETWNDPFVRS